MRQPLRSSLFRPVTEIVTQMDACVDPMSPKTETAESYPFTMPAPAVMSREASRRSGRHVRNFTPETGLILKSMEFTQGKRSRAETAVSRLQIHQEPAKVMAEPQTLSKERTLNKISTKNLLHPNTSLLAEIKRQSQECDYIAAGQRYLDGLISPSEHHETTRPSKHRPLSAISRKSSSEAFRTVCQVQTHIFTNKKITLGTPSRISHNDLRVEETQDANTRGELETMLEVVPKRL